MPRPVPLSGQIGRAGSGRAWTASILAALGLSGETPHRLSATAGFMVWERLPRWEEQAPEPRPPAHHSVEPAVRRARVWSTCWGHGAEAPWPQQVDYASSRDGRFCAHHGAKSSRSAMYLIRGITCSMPPILPFSCICRRWRRPSCVAGCWAPRMAVQEVARAGKAGEYVSASRNWPKRTPWRLLTTCWKQSKFCPGRDGYNV